MHETPEDLERLQELLDRSYARAGSHLRSIWDEETRLDARALSAVGDEVRALCQRFPVYRTRLA